MKFDIDIDFKRAKEEADLLLISSHSVNTFPFAISKLIKEKSDVVCTSYKTVKSICPELNCEDLGSDDAEIIEYGGKRLILINKEKYDTRVRFSVAHEFGHHILKHNLNEKEDKIIDKYEVEANMFSAELLMPEDIINEFKHRGLVINKENLMKWFNVSKEAAEKRIKYLYKRDSHFMSNEEEDNRDLLLIKFNGFINSIAPLNYIDNEEDIQKERDQWLYDRRH